VDTVGSLPSSTAEPSSIIRPASGWSGEADIGALADGLVAEGLGDVCLSDADGPEQKYEFTGVKPVQGRAVADVGGGQFRGGVEAEALQGHPLLELGSAQTSFERDAFAAGDFVVAEAMEEVEVSEFVLLGLSEGEHRGFGASRTAAGA
jgi:hypothetical protein